MEAVLRFARSRVARVALAGLVAGGVAGLAACDTVLNVEDPDILTPGSLEGDPASVPLTINAIVGTFQEQMDNYIRKTGLLTDEFILAGTFPTRKEIDDRNMVPDNATLTGAFYEPLHSARFQADAGFETLQTFVGAEGADQDQVAEGLAFGRYYGGFSRLLLAEAFCQSILGGGEEGAEAGPISPNERMQDALAFFQEAESLASAAGLADVVNAARVGQARAHLWLENFAQAASVAATVPDGFEYQSFYSANDPSQYNEIYTFTYGDTQVIRWTVGDGTVPARFNEAWPYFDEWVALGLIDPAPGLLSFDSTIPVKLQCLHGGCVAPPNPLGRASDVLIASGYEADMIEAEVAARNGDAAGAGVIVNARLNGNNPLGLVFAPAAFTGSLANDLAEIARARAAGLWLTGERLGTFRRFLRDGVDLYPDKPGGDTAFPVVQQELDNNPNISQACPSGPPFN